MIPGSNPGHLDTVGAQMRRRRTAAQRCQPLETGHRDPIDQVAVSTPARTYKPVSVTVDGKVIVVRGYVRDILRSAGMKPLWSSVTRGFVLDVGKLPDVLAALQHAGLNVDVREHDAR